MTHYVCKGDCGGTSNEVNAVCSNETCSAKGESLVECSCGDDTHATQ